MNLSIYSLLSLGLVVTSCWVSNKNPLNCNVAGDVAITGIWVLLQLRSSPSTWGQWTSRRAWHWSWNVTWLVLRCRQSAGTVTHSQSAATTRRWAWPVARRASWLVSCGQSIAESMCVVRLMWPANQQRLLPSASSVSTSASPSARSHAFDATTATVTS